MKYLANWKLRHDKEQYKKGDIIEGIELPASTVASGVVTVLEGESSNGNGSGDTNGDGTPLTNQKEGLPFIESCEDVVKLEALLVTENESKNSRKWALGGLEARIAVLKTDVDGNNDQSSENNDGNDESKED